MTFLLILAALILIVLIAALVLSLRDPERKDYPFHLVYLGQLSFILLTVIINGSLALLEGIVHFVLWCEDFPAKIRQKLASFRKHP